MKDRLATTVTTLRNIRKFINEFIGEDPYLSNRLLCLCGDDDLCEIDLVEHYATLAIVYKWSPTSILKETILTPFGDSYERYKKWFQILIEKVSDRFPGFTINHECGDVDKKFLFSYD